MDIFSTYSVKIKNDGYNSVFKKTVSIYRDVVDYLITVCLNEWDEISSLGYGNEKSRFVEALCHKTAANASPKYADFDKRFYKLPCYLRRSATAEAIGRVSSYKSNLNNWENGTTKGKPSLPHSGYTYPCLYKVGMFEMVGCYEAKIKAYIHNTWDWVTVRLRKSDIDYITRHCKDRKECAPTLQKRGKQWFLDFPFKENVKLNDTVLSEQTIVAVDLGINTSATVSVMSLDGTVLGRYFCKLPKEYDSLGHSVNRVKKAQQHGNHKTPRLWAKVNGINDDIAVKTANFIVDVAKRHKADVIVFEYLDKKGKIRGPKKQRLKLWRSQYVQAMVADKAHRLGMHVRHICAWNTSKLAYDGSGVVSRGKAGGFNTYELCRFPGGKVYNCDLSASYNIGARYFINEILKSLSVSSKLHVEAKVPQCCKRNTCTLSTLISLNAALCSCNTNV